MWTLLSRAILRVFWVDEWPHTNIPGSKHRKRYEDVQEILAREDRCSPPPSPFSTSRALRRWCAPSLVHRARNSSGLGPSDGHRNRDGGPHPGKLCKTA